jgi:hypothetical protein
LGLLALQATPAGQAPVVRTAAPLAAAIEVFQ